MGASEKMNGVGGESPACDAQGISACWWAVYTRHQHEKTVAGMLGDKGFETFLPLYESVRRWKDRSKMLQMPLFPGYVFLRGEMSQKLQVVSTPGIHSILYHGERLATIPDVEIEAIRKAVNGKLRVEPHPYLRCGDRVRVTRGSLRDVEGVLIRKKNLTRLVLSVQMLAQSVAVEIDALDVEPVDARKGQGAGMRQGLGPEAMLTAPTATAMRGRMANTAQAHSAGEKSASA